MKVVTALANQNLNIQLSKINDIEIVAPDIQYQEGVIEILEEKNNIDILILSEVLIGNLNIKEFIIKIKNINKKINIIIILENKEESLENFLISKGIFEIYYNNEIEIKEMINIIKNKNTSNTIQNKNIKNKTYKVKRINKKAHNGIIISILGTHESGKSIFSINLIKSIENKKVLLIDLDLLNNSINNILNIKDKNNKIIKLNKKMYLLNGIKIINKNTSNLEIKTLFKKLKNEFDYIIIDNTSECFFDVTRYIIKNSDKCIFLLEANLLEINKSRKILNIYLQNWYIEKNKINIVLNKYNKNSIDDNVLKNIFYDIKILGKINYDDYYNLLINKKFNTILKNKKLELQYKKIFNSLVSKNNFLNLKIGGKNGDKFIRE